jgi:8-amino-7-oxononanoate synthase
LGIACAILMSAWMQDDLAERERQGLLRIRRPLQSGQGVHVLLRGRQYLNFSSNDYLNLASYRRLARAAAAAALRYGTGAGASPLVSGHHPPLRALEHDLAQWEESEAAIVFSSGFATNLAVVSSLAGKGDAIFSDAFNHASLIDGCRLSGAKVYVYRHLDLGHLEEQLVSAGAKARRRLIVSDSVFSMDGDLAPVPELMALADRHDAMLVLDEAHATGILGEHGRGLSEVLTQCERSSGRLFKVGTLSKALGTQGGFIIGSRTQIAFLVNHARPYIFSTALSPPTAAAARVAVRVLQAEPQRRVGLLCLAEQLRDDLRALGLGLGNSKCQIVPLILGDSHKAVAVSRRLQSMGLLVPAIRPPSVPEGTARLRISLTAAHTAEDLARLTDALRETLPAFAP